MPDPSAKSLFNIYQVQLGRFFADNEFNIEVKSNLLPLVSSSIVMYYRVFINMLPTPSKSHYVFNLRDLSKLVNGLMQAYPSVVTNRDDLVSLFAHESIRIFNDRLVTREDNEAFYVHLNETIQDYFKVSINNPYRPVPKKGNSETIEPTNTGPSVVSRLSAQPDTDLMLYGDFIKNDERVYQPLNNWKQLISILSEYQMRSNMSGHATKQIVFFKEAVEHVCRYLNLFIFKLHLFSLF
jgi:dynein heavy chain